MGDESDNTTFATGWYAGYVAGFIVEAIVGSKGSTKLVDSLGEFSSTIGRLQDAYGGLRAAISGATVSPAKQFALQFGRELKDIGFSTRAGKAVLEGVSVAKQFALKQRLRVRLGSEVVDGLSNQEQRFLGRLARRPDVDASTLRRLDEDGALDDVLALRRCRVSASVATSGAAVLGTPISCPAVPQADLTTAASRLSNAIDDGAIDTDDAATIRRAVLDNDDVDGGVVVRTLRDGDDEAAQFLATADDEALTTFTRLSRQSDGDIPEGTLRQYARVNGEDGARLVNDLDGIDDPDALESFFELDGPDNEEISDLLAFGVRHRLTEGHADDLISAKGVRDVADNANSLDAEARVEGVDDVLQEVDSTEVNADLWDRNHKGALYELESGNGFITGKLDEGEDFVMSFEPLSSERVDADDIDFSKLADSDSPEDQAFVETMATEFDFPENKVRKTLRGADESTGPEFDGVRFANDGTGRVVYYESKAGKVNSPDIKRKLIRFKAYARLDPKVNVDDIEFVLLTRRSDVSILGIVDDVEWARHESHPWDFREASTSQPSMVAPSIRAQQSEDLRPRPSPRPAGGGLLTPG